MSKFTARQVEDALKDVEELDWYNLAWEDYDQETLNIEGEEVKFSLVESDPGGEGHGEYVFLVIKVGDQLFRKEGFYASHHGTDWDGDFSEVEPKGVTVTKYVKKKS